jgi:hypothetical protein
MQGQVGDKSSANLAERRESLVHLSKNVAKTAILVVQQLVEAGI